MENPTYFMGTEVFPLEPNAATRERFISLHQLMHWLQKSPHPKGTWPPCIALLGLAHRHIKAGRLRTYGVSSRATIKPISVQGEFIEDGKVHEAEIFDMRVEVQEQHENPLLDIFEFTDWFREINPDGLRLPDNWPALATIAGAPATNQPTAEPIEPFRFHYVRTGSGYTRLCEELASTLYLETGKNASAEQAWARLLNAPPAGYGLKVRKIDGMSHIEIAGELPISKTEFRRRWNRWTAPLNEQ